MKKVAIVLVLVAIVAAIVVVFTDSDVVSFDVRLTDSQVEEAMTDEFPISLSANGLADITLDSPQVELTEGSDRMVVSVDATANVAGARVVGGSAVVETGIGFNPDTREILLDNPELLTLSIDNLVQDLPIVTSVVSQALRAALDGTPVYKVEADDVETTIARLFLKDVRIENGLVVVTLGV